VNRLMSLLSMVRKTYPLWTTWVLGLSQGSPYYIVFCMYKDSYHLHSVTFGISIGLSAVSLIVERNEGLIDRTWVAGVNVPEIIISQVITQFFVLLLQISLLVIVALFGFKVSSISVIGSWCS